MFLVSSNCNPSSSMPSSGAGLDLASALSGDPTPLGIRRISVALPKEFPRFPMAGSVVPGVSTESVSNVSLTLVWPLFR
jgi:hypothetical protein